MSRSYRHNVIFKGSQKAGTKKKWKRFANKSVRNTRDVPNGMSYKKCLDLFWVVIDQRWGYLSKKDYIKKCKLLDIPADDWWRYYRK